MIIDNQTVAGVQNAAVGNAANQYKIGRYVDITNTCGQGMMVMMSFICSFRNKNVYCSTGLMTTIYSKV